MLDNTPLSILGNQGSWLAKHSRITITGLLELYSYDTPILKNCFCEIDDITDRLALLDSFKSWKKGSKINVETKGHLPYGSEIKLKHTYRYSHCFIKISTELIIPRKTIIRERVGIGSHFIPGDWLSYRTIDISDTSDLILSDWQDIGCLTQNDNLNPLVGFKTWDKAPLAVIFKNIDSMEVEIGIGNDIWRWEKGISGSCNESKFALYKKNNGILFERYVTVKQTDFEPVPGQYTFTWYVSWSSSQNKQTKKYNFSLLEPSWKENGDLDFSAMNDLLSTASTNSAFNINVTNLNWPESCNRNYECSDYRDCHPCFASGKTVKRLKRVIRQFAAADQSEIPLYFSSIVPGVCSDGRHVSRRGEKIHWDISDMVDFSAWTRKILGPNRNIINDSGTFDCPSIRSLFSTQDLSLH